MRFFCITCLLFLISCSSTKKESVETKSSEIYEEQSAPKSNLSDVVSECKNQDVASALKVLSNQYANYKNDSNYWNLLGACFLSDEKPLKARLFFLRALEEDKSNLAALNNLGIVYWKMNKHYDALLYFKRAESINSSAVAVRYNLGRFYSWYGLHKISNDKFRELSSSVLSQQDYKFIATNQLMLGQYEDAMKNFKKSHQTENKLLAVYALALKKNGQIDEAQSLWRQANLASSDSLNWLWILGE